MNQEELHKIAPTLSLIPKTSSFEVPEYYFDEVENTVLSKWKLDALDLKKDTSIFKTPANYFDNLETVVISKLKAEKAQLEQENRIPKDYFETIEDRVFETLKSERKTISIKTIGKFLAPIAIAASLLLIFMLNSTNETVTFDSLATAEIEQFIDYGMIDIDEQTLARAFDDLEYQTEELITSLSDNETLEYLYDEDLEIIMYEN